MMKVFKTFSAAAVAIACLSFSTAGKTDAATPVPVLADKSAVAELTYWNSIKDSSDADDYRTYLENFPNGMFVDPAMDRFEKSGGTKSDLSPAVISASLNATTEPVIIEDSQPSPAQVATPRPIQKKVIKSKKKVVQARTRKKTVKTVRTKSSKKCATKSIYDSKCLTVAKSKKAKLPVVRKQRIVAGGSGSSGGGGSSPPASGWGGGGSGSGGGWGD